ncbi:MAG: hypothetical protein GX774_07375 [Armatimonadetes bacterium]|nr:hypothetical protein [Armatimonadota bacterium]
MALPELSEPSVTGSPGVAGAPFVGYPGSAFIYRVRYRHPDNVPPAYVRVRILNPSATHYSELRVLMLTREPGQSGSEADPGIFYSNAVKDAVSEGPFAGFGAPGTYHYYFEASDGQRVTTLDFGGRPFDGPVVAAPALSPLGVTPVRGVRAEPFTFQVRYAHPAGVRPASVRLRLIGPKGDPIPLANNGAMDPPEAPVDAELVSPGWVFTSKPILLPEVGTYRYSFLASDGYTEVEAPLPTTAGPVALPVEPAVLSGASALPAAGMPNKVTYRLTYQQSQGLVPLIWVVVGGQSYPMERENPADEDLSDGAVFAATLDRPAGAGPHQYHFIVRAPGIDLRFPQTGSFGGPNAAPLLEVPAGGTVSPLAGSEGTLFTFQVRCRDVDATTDPVVQVVVGNQQLPMAKVSGDVTGEGALYALQTRLPAGKLVHRFLASDGQDTARLEASGGEPFAGPEVLPQTALNVSVTPRQLSLDGTTAITVTGRLMPVVPAADLRVTYQPPTGAPVVQDVLADADGRFSDRFVPNRGGTWNVSVEYVGEAGTIGGGQEGPFPVSVAPSTFALPAGVSMIGLPVLPDGGDLGQILGAGVRVARWNGSGYDFGPGDSLPPLKPGMGVWVLRESAHVAQAVGTAVTPNQAVAVPVQKGWNQVANPYLAPVAWASVSFQPVGGAARPLAQAAQEGSGRLAWDHAWLYEGTQYALVHATVPGAARHLEPWQAVWFKANVAGNLIFAPPGSREADIAGASAERRVRRAANDWDIQVVATNGEQSDSFNFAGVTPDGRAANAALESPPVLSRYLDLYFTGVNGTGRLATDYRSPAASRLVWELTVETDVVDRPVILKTPNLASVPKELDVVLEDVDGGGKRTYLRTAGGYSFHPGQQGRRHFRLIVEPRSEGALRISGVEVTPTRGGRAISCSVSRAALLTVELLGPAGRRLKLVADRQATAAGRATVWWDGTREDGARLPAGVYLVQVTAVTPEGQSAREIKPMVVVRW